MWTFQTERWVRDRRCLRTPRRRSSGSIWRRRASSSCSPSLSSSSMRLVIMLSICHPLRIHNAPSRLRIYNASSWKSVASDPPLSRVTIYAPMIYTAPCVMFLMRAHTLCGEVGGSWRWKSRVLWAPVKLHEPIGECDLGPNSNSPPPPTSSHNARIKNITHWAI